MGGCCGKKICMMAGLALLLAAGVSSGILGQQYGGTLRVATEGDPVHLDLMIVTASNASTIGQHIFDTLFVLDENSSPIPLLVESYERNIDGTLVTFTLREGVLFHNGEELDSGDVVASVKRWLEYGVRGKVMAPHVTDIMISAMDKYRFSILFSEPFAPMENLFAWNNGGPCIYLQEVAEAAGKEPIAQSDYIGTGPYKFSDWLPGQYLRLVRFEDYMSPPGESSGYGGHRNAYIDELLFIPVPEAATRVAGVRAGDYDYAIRLPQDLYDDLNANLSIHTHLLTPPSFMQVFRNTQKGLMTNDKLFQAIRMALDFEPILQATYGTLYELDGALFPPGSIWHTTAGTEIYNQADPQAAMELAREAGYNGEQIRYVVSTTYHEHYNTGMVVADQLSRAGFNIDLQLYDWATVVQYRADPDMWDLFSSGHGPVPDPTLITCLNPNYPGWWDTPQKRLLLDSFTTATDFDERFSVWEELQTLLYDEGSMIKTGDGYILTISSAERVGGIDVAHQPALLFPYFWNAWMK